MSAANFASAPHHYSPLPGKPLGGLPQIRRNLPVPEVVPLLGVMSVAMGVGAYLGAAQKVDAPLVSHTEPWLTSADQTRWDSAGAFFAGMNQNKDKRAARKAQWENECSKALARRLAH